MHRAKLLLLPIAIGLTLTLGYEHGAQGVATGGALAAVVHRVDPGDNEVSYVITGLQRPAGPIGRSGRARRRMAVRGQIR